MRGRKVKNCAVVESGASGVCIYDPETRDRLELSWCTARWVAAMITLPENDKYARSCPVMGRAHWARASKPALPPRILLRSNRVWTKFEREIYAFLEKNLRPKQGISSRKGSSSSAQSAKKAACGKPLKKGGIA